jgi:NAD(P)-dependent dehydrogenase (short-subunit alcohol dehydrogenase family)
MSAFGRIDVLHDNVGIVEMGGPVETSEESWDRVTNVNLKSMFLSCKHVLPHMERQDEERSSTSLRSPVPAGSAFPMCPMWRPKLPLFNSPGSRLCNMRAPAFGRIRACPGLMNTPMVHAPRSLGLTAVTSTN